MLLRCVRCSPSPRKKPAKMPALPHLTRIHFLTICSLAVVPTTKEIVMSLKCWLLITITAALVGWAGLETQRLCLARKQLAASAALQKQTTQRAEVVRLKYAQA